MEIIRSTAEMQKKMVDIKYPQNQIGFVPTMGFFHEGHINLMKNANEENDIVVTSIFVNPLQFGPSEDYEQYPRNEQLDIKQAEQAGVDILFIPDVQEIYPDQMIISMSIEDRVNVLCGGSRPGHFEGVVTVLTKLFNIIQPDKAYFGMKDAQQVAVVKALVNDLNFPIEVVAVPTTREQDGLAKSSRNVYLSEEERECAVWLFKALKQGQQLVVDGEKNSDIIVKDVIDTIQKNTSATIDYVELLSYPELQPISTVEKDVILAAAVHFHRARLIDNLLFDDNGNVAKHIK